MSFVSKGEKVMHNKAKGGKKGGERPLPKDSFGKKGHKEMHNMAPGSNDKEATPVTEDAGDGYGCDSGKTEKGSEYDPASGKRAKSVADLRSASKKLNERSMAGSDSPVGSEGGQDATNDSDQNATGWMKGGMGPMDKKSKKPPRGQASQDADDDQMTDPMDEEEEDSGQTKDGMTPSGTSRKKIKSLKDVKNALKKLSD